MNYKDPTGSKRVLIVDDEPSLRDLFAVALTGEAREIFTCGDGFTALRALRESEFDLVLLDLSLPDTSGIDILREMRLRNDRTPVVLCTAHVDESSFLNALELGVDRFIAKPVTLNTLREVVDIVINQKNSETGSASEFARKCNLSEKARLLANSGSERQLRCM